MKDNSPPELEGLDTSSEAVEFDGTESPAARPWTEMFFGQLPLQNETTMFILVNVLDIFMTYILLRFGAMESNPIANYFFVRWGFIGLISFKLVIVAVVCLISQFVALTRLQTARWLLYAGTVIVASVVIYSVVLMLKHYST